MYLIGGPPFSGTTLLALLLNQGDSVCLDEPDFDKPEQRHRGIPHLRTLFPDATFPPPPDTALTPEEAVHFIAACEAAIAPYDLGMKTCGGHFVEYAKVYRARGHPVIAVVRDIRDALATPLAPWLTEDIINREYRRVWENRALYDLWFRYEELVHGTAAVMARISGVLGHRFDPLETWDPARVNVHMLKLDRHARLKDGRIVRDRVGVWKGSDRSFSDFTRDTAALMGYGS